MADLDIAALLDSTENGKVTAEETLRNDRSDRRDRSRDRHGDRDRDRDGRRIRSRDRRRSGRDADGDAEMKSPPSDKGSANGSHRSRRRSRSPDSDRHRSRRHRDELDRDDHYRGSGDFYRGGGRHRTRSRSPESDRHYRPGRRDRDDRDDRRDRDRDRDRDRGSRRDRGGRRRTPSPRRNTQSPTPAPNEDERDRRTVFVQQLAARLRTKNLIEFFEKAGPVKDAQIVKDRISGRSKGVGYVEFKSEESIPAAIQLTGQKLLGIPIIAQNAEAEKNRAAARNPEGNHHPASGVPFHRLYVGNIHFSISEQDLHNVFEPFGELEFVQLQKEEQGRSRGYGFVQFLDPEQAKEALEKMNGFELAGRPIRVGLGNDKFTPESTAKMLQQHGSQFQGQAYQGSAFSGSGGRGAHAGGAGFDRAGGRDNDKAAGGASALDDTDVAGVNFSNFSRDALMRKLARTEDPAETKTPQAARPRTNIPAPPVNVPQASRCIVIKNAFDPASETGDNWVQELESEFKDECEQQYGRVVHISVDPNSQGDVFIKFERIDGGEKAIQGLNGRFFGGNRITAQPVVDAVYSSLFARTRAI